MIRYNKGVKKLPHWCTPVCATCLAIWLLTLVVSTTITFTYLQKKQLHQSAQAAHFTQLLFFPISFTLSPVIPDVQLMSNSLQLIQQADQLTILTKLYVPATLAADPDSAQQALQLHREIMTLTGTLSSWSEAYRKSKVLPYLIKKSVHQTELLALLDHPEEIKKLAQMAQVLSAHFLQGHHRYAILLQNSDELRATGGFMGSYGLFEIKDGVVQQLDVQDIYVPAGQFTGYISPPAGVAEFLSSGKGWQLPDSNWNPDFPAAAEDITHFFDLGKVNNLEGIVTLNLPVAEHLLGITGPVYLPDFNQTVTAENLSTLARADRQTFFAGSQQKRQFLHALFSQLKMSIADLTAENFTQIKNVLIEAAQHKDIQVFSRDQEIQHFSQEYHLAGLVSSQGSPRYFFLVESNVGINKANRLVTRQVQLSLQDYSSSIQIQFSNLNPPTSLRLERGEYINYQRLLIPAHYLVHHLEVNGHPLAQWDESLVTTSTGEQLKQVGFLVTVPAQAQGTVLIEFAHPLLSVKTLTLQKQSGLASVPYHIITPTAALDILLEKDQVIQLP